MGVILHKGEVYGGAGGGSGNSIPLHYAEYLALSQSAKDDPDKYYYIDDLDVSSPLLLSLTTPSDRQALMYDGTNNVWANVNLFNLIYPVGSIYMSVNNVNPGTLFGGTWERWGNGKVAVGVDENDTNFDTVEETGGEATHQLSVTEMPQHTHTFTGTRAQSEDTNTQHRHYNDITNGAQSGGATGMGNWMKDGGTTAAITIGQIMSSYGAGNYKMVPSTFTTPNHTHNVKGWSSYVNNTASTASVNHKHYFTPSGSNADAGSSNSHNNLQPYITCYMWKRTA